MAPSPGTPSKAAPTSPDSPQVVTPPAPATAASFAEALKTDRTLQIHVGQDSGLPFLIPQSVLCNASDYFVKAVKNEKLGGGESGVLRFPEDDLQAWQLLLFWIVNSTLPTEVYWYYQERSIEIRARSLHILINSWIMGDRYLLPQFQDVIMLELLNCSLEAWPLEVTKAAFRGTLPGTPLRRLAAEETLWLFFQSTSTTRPQISELDDLDDAVGALGSILTAVQKSSQETTLCDNLGRTPSRVKAGGSWREYMVGSGPPARHWVYEES